MIQFTKSQEAALEHAVDADGRYRTEARALQTAIREELGVRLADLYRDRDLAVRSAFELGVPVREIATFGLNTSCVVDVTDSLARTARDAA